MYPFGATPNGLFCFSFASRSSEARDPDPESSVSGVLDIGPMSDRVVNPDAPRPKPATYPFGAWLLRNDMVVVALLC